MYSDGLRVQSSICDEFLKHCSLQAFVTVLFSILIYFIAGYQYNAGKFFIFVATCVVFILIAETIGIVCAIATKTVTMAIIMSSSILMVRPTSLYT